MRWEALGWRECVCVCVWVWACDVKDSEMKERTWPYTNNSVVIYQSRQTTFTPCIASLVRIVEQHQHTRHVCSRCSCHGPGCPQGHVHQHGREHCSPKRPVP